MSTLDYQPAPPSKPFFTLPRIFTAISVLLFFGSLPSPAFFAKDAWASGLGPLLMGWLGVFELSFAWFANPLLLLAWLLLQPRNGRPFALLVSLAALTLALSVLALPTYVADDLGEYKIEHYGLGYYLWLASIATVLVGAIVSIVRDEPPPKDPSKPSNAPISH